VRGGVLGGGGGGERWAPRVWWAALALGTGFALGWWWGERAGWGRLGWAGAGLWGVAWMAPWLAVASCRGRRGEAERPEEGGGSTEDWLEYGEELLKRLAWAETVCRGAAETSGRVENARKGLKRALKKGVREARALENACAEAEKEGLDAFQAWLWAEAEGVSGELADEYTREGGADGGRRFERLSEAMADAASTVVRRVAPMMLAEEQLEGVRECVGLAWAGAGEATDDGRMIALAAALAMEWGDWGVPWEPWGALERAGERAGVIHNSQCTMQNGEERGREEDGTEAGGPPALRQGKRRVRVKVWRKGRRKKRGGLGRELRRMGEIFVAFGQRMRYFLTAWWLYRN
ncbi:MAG: hypothetical protein IK066_02385, partial [Kiritimatiellae bacterium]|nr:hypothetical protein [Kiritimatiellia bacterium]